MNDDYDFYYLNENYKILIALTSKDHLYLLEDMLNSVGITYESTNNLNIPTNSNIGISLFTLPRGFVLNDEKIVVLTSFELFNTRIRP